MITSDSLQGIDVTQITGPLASMLQAADFKKLGDDIGREIVPGISAGIGYGGQHLSKREIDDVSDAVLNAAKDSFEIHSPSKKMEPIGLGVVAGISKGIGDNASLVTGSIKDVYAAAIAEVRRQEPLLKNAMRWLSEFNGWNGSGGPGGAGGPAQYTKNYSTSANQYIENYNVNRDIDAQALLDQQAALLRRSQAGHARTINCTLPAGEFLEA
jgi:hypothetical protein